MRQAGRYLPEYRKLRAQVKDFLSLCKTPELACEITLQPIERYPLDAAIIFSDILVIPDAYGLDLHFEEGLGPIINKPVQTESDIKKLPLIDPTEKLSYVMDLIKITAETLKGKVPLIGFSGSPWTVATYMVEGRSSKQFNIIKRMMYQNPKALHAILEHLTQTTIDYLNAQIEAGVEVVMLFDTWGGVLSLENYLTFSLAYMKKIIKGLKPKRGTVKTPVILFTKQAGPYLSHLKHSGAEGIGIDWTIDIKQAREMMAGECALQGNLDPSVLYAEEETIRREVSAVLKGFGSGSGHVFNLGHGMHPDCDPEKVNIMLEAVHEFSPAYHNPKLINESNV